MGEKSIVRIKILAHQSHWQTLRNATFDELIMDVTNAMLDQQGVRLVEGFTARYNSLVEIPGIAIFLAERRNMVLRCFQDGFLAHVHKYLGFLVTDPVDMLR